jgi:predicted CXXCH cytochrome family protein
MGAKVKHAPVELGDCSACHNPHVSRFDGLLRQRPASLCVECHGDLQAALEMPVVHAPVADGRCVDCHRPHGAENADLLASPLKQLCRDCHSEVESWEARKEQHPPFAQGDCATCHDPHASEHPGLAEQAGGAACASCHPVTAAFTQKHNGYPVERAPCQQCHDPHASDQAGLFRAHLHPPFAEGDCTTCHVSAGASDPFALTERQDALCGVCHEEQVEASRTAAFPHVSAGGGECTDCHNPHTGDSESLIAGSQQALCLTCHDPGGARSGQQGRHVSHGMEQEMDCTACHLPHGGDQPLFLEGGSVDLCGTCHTHQHGIRHPLGEGTRDPRTGAPMDCISCHGLHDAPYEMYLHRSQERELCLGCHKDIGGGR